MRVLHPFCTDRSEDKLIRSGVTRRRGGAKRSRTADLLSAIQALYQLSYSPWNWRVCTIPIALGSLRSVNVCPICGRWSAFPKLHALPCYGYLPKATTWTAYVNESPSATSGTRHNFTPHVADSSDNKEFRRHLGISTKLAVAHKSQAKSFREEASKLTCYPTIIQAANEARAKQWTSKIVHLFSQLITIDIKLWARRSKPEKQIISGQEHPSKPRRGLR